MVGENEDSYRATTRDELTGLPKLFYFSREFNRKKAGLGRSGESNLLLCLHLHETTPEDKVKAVAEYWKEKFLRVCRYEKRDYTFLALDKDASDPNAKEEEILEALASINPALVVDVKSVVIDGNSGSVDELVAELAK
jgi:hypothetical protein